MKATQRVLATQQHQAFHFCTTSAQQKAPYYDITMCTRANSTMKPSSSASKPLKNHRDAGNSPMEVTDNQLCCCSCDCGCSELVASPSRCGYCVKYCT